MRLSLAVLVLLWLGGCQLALPGGAVHDASASGEASSGDLSAQMAQPETLAELSASGIEVVDGGGAQPATALIAKDREETIRPETHGVPSEVPPETPARPAKPGLFGFLRPSTGAGEAAATKSTVRPGEQLPFGEIGVACETTKRSMGQQVDQFPREGRPVWRLYDTDPSSTAPRTQFITGFADGCARQVTAALVMFGAAGLHEVLRYSDDSDRSWSQADKTYEKIKRRTCGVGRGKFCPAGSLDSLERQVSFVSVYPYFGAEEGWLELLLHDGQVMSEEMR